MDNTNMVETMDNTNMVETMDNTNIIPMFGFRNKRRKSGLSTTKGNRELKLTESLN
jgi:hypothetical protein